MTSREPSQLRGQQGFTLIELLVVVLIIGILAAIALPNFLIQRERGQDASAKSLVRVGASAIEVHQIQKGSYDVSSADVLGIAPELKGAPAWSLAAAPDSFTIGVTSRSGREFRFARNPDGSQTHVCSPVGGGCPDTGIW